MHVVVGLGNPGPRYAQTRHNIGFVVVDRLAAQRGAPWSVREEVFSHLAAVQIADRDVVLVKPQTYMNRSGAAVVALQGKLGFSPAEILVLQDDFSLDFGRLRLRRGGSDGGHNGLASILSELCTQEVPRLRLGIGAPPADQDPIDYVLAAFGPEEDVAGLAERACRAVEAWVQDGIDPAMNQFNGLAGL